MYKIIQALFLFALLCSCKKVSVTDDPTKDPGTGETVVYNVNKNTLLTLVNTVRQSGCTCGTTKMPAVATVAWNDQLSTAAYAHSSDMFENDYFSHTGEDGSNPGARIRNAGYAWRAYGENIAMGYTDEEKVMQGWLNSEGHCKNIMNAAFKEMGAGRQSGYWTQEFGAK